MAGLIFLIEPINYRMGVPSVYLDLEKGKSASSYQLFAGRFGLRVALGIVEWGGLYLTAVWSGTINLNPIVLGH